MSLIFWCKFFYSVVLPSSSADVGVSICGSRQAIAVEHYRRRERAGTGLVGSFCETSQFCAELYFNQEYFEGTALEFLI